MSEARRRTTSRDHQLNHGDSTTVPLGNGLNRRRPKAPSREGNDNFALSRRGMHIFACFGIMFLVGVHLYLLRVVLKSFDRDGSHVFDAPASGSLTPLTENDRSQYTIRINTWKRFEQLMVSIHHHASCPGVAQIQVVWCTDQGDVPDELQAIPKVVVELHPRNSLNERFRVLKKPPTLGILSMDDDVLRTCNSVDSGFFKWTMNPSRIVGFDARSHLEADNGTWKYGYMSTTEKANRYSLTLPRYAFIHRDYLYGYMHDMPASIRDKVTEYLNCEDIALSFYVSSRTDGAPPLLADYWSMKSMIKLYSPDGGISGMKGHKSLRDDCVESFANTLHLKDKLMSATIFHSNTMPFDSGAESEALTDTPKSERHEEFKALIQSWKKLSRDQLLKELKNQRAEMGQEAFLKGLVPDTKPWKKRWKHHHHHHHEGHHAEDEAEHEESEGIHKIDNAEEWV